MTPERLKVAESMVFCIEHSEAADEICDCIAESLSILQTPIPKKVIAAFYTSCGCGTWCFIRIVVRGTLGCRGEYLDVVGEWKKQCNRWKSHIPLNDS